MKTLTGKKTRTALCLAVGLLLIALGTGVAQAQGNEIGTVAGILQNSDFSEPGRAHPIHASWESNGESAGFTHSLANGAWTMDLNTAGLDPNANHRVWFKVEEQLVGGLLWPYHATVILTLPAPVPTYDAPLPTQAALPTHTPLPPLPTQAALPTHTPLPPLPTQAALPTHTPLPPLPTQAPLPTPLPTATSTPVPTPLPTATSTPAERLDRLRGQVEGFEVAPEVSLRPVNDVVSSDADGIIEAWMYNSALNKVNLIVEIKLSVPSGLHISSSDGSFTSGAGQGVAKYFVEPGQGREIQFMIQADKVGGFTVSSDLKYWPEHHENLWNPISLSHPFEVTAATSRSRINRAPESGPAGPETETPGPGAGCGIGADGGKADLAMIMLGGSLLTGMGLMLVRGRA